MNFLRSELEDLSKIAQTAAIAAGQYIQSQFVIHHERRYKKGGESLASQVVTDVDVQAQHIIIEELEKVDTQYDFGLLSEEMQDDNSRLEKDYFWCIDPLDGTLPFIEGQTGYAVSVALVSKAGNPLVGAAYIPDLEICFTAIKGSGVFKNGSKFLRDDRLNDGMLHFYADRSFLNEQYYKEALAQLEGWAMEHGIGQVTTYYDFGAVRNALGVMTSGIGCYFKLPKTKKGGGSIWDYAVTRLLFEELGLQVCDSSGSRLYLNNPYTTYMNSVGVLYATNSALKNFVLSLREDIT